MVKLPIVVLLAITVVVGCSDGGTDSAAESESTTTNPTAPTTTEPAVPEAPARPGVPVVIAHRGASAAAPEHTTAAYDLAMEQGADYLEQDLYLTEDGALVVLHDPTLDRTARGPAESCTGPVVDKTLAQLRQCEFGSWFNEAHPDLADPSFEGLPILTIAEVFERYGAGVRYYVEVKIQPDSEDAEEALIRVLDDAGLLDQVETTQQVLVQSFNPDSLRRLHQQRPELPLVQLFPPTGGAIDDATLDVTAEYAVGIGPNVADVDQGLVDRAGERCLAVHPYTVDEPPDMDRLLDLGVHGMFTNRPDVLIGRRGDRALPVHANCD